MLKEGEAAPDFELRSDEGDPVRLSDYRGQKVILYFYPKDDTPGCTIEACEFRDRLPEIRDRDAVVLGVSPDDVDSHRKFKQKYELPFVLLADTDHEVAEAYGVWGEKKRYGRTYEGIHRTTFLIGKDGKVERVFEKVRPEGHSEEVLEALGGD